MDRDLINKFLGENPMEVTFRDQLIKLRTLNYEFSNSDGRNNFKIKLNISSKDLTGKKEYPIIIENFEFNLIIDFDNFTITLENITNYQANQIFNSEYPVFKYFIFKVVVNFLHSLALELDISNYEEIEIFPAQIALNVANKGLSFSFVPRTEEHSQYLKNNVNFLIVAEMFLSTLRESSYKAYEAHEL